MKLSEEILKDVHGNYYYQNCFAKPYQQYQNRSEWVVVVGEMRPGCSDHRVWRSAVPCYDPLQVCMSAIDWYKKEVVDKKELVPSSCSNEDEISPSSSEEMKNDGPKI